VSEPAGPEGHGADAQADHEPGAPADHGEATARRVLPLLVVGALAVLLVDAVLVAVVVGWYAGFAGSGAPPEEYFGRLLRGAAGALIAVAVLAAVITAVVVTTLLVVKARRHVVGRR
jgi:hypothetical protein